MSHQVNLKKFCENSSFHGFSEIYSARNWFWKLFWSLVVVAAAGVTGYQVYAAVNMYWKQPTITSVYPLRGDIERPDMEFCFRIKYFYVWLSFGKLFNQTRTMENMVARLIAKLTRIPNFELFFNNSQNMFEPYSSWVPNDHGDLITQSILNYNKILEASNVANEFSFIQQFVSQTPNVRFMDMVPAKKVTILNDTVCYTYPLDAVLPPYPALVFANFMDFYDNNMQFYAKIDANGPLVYNMLLYAKNGLLNESSSSENFMGVEENNLFTIGIGNLKPIVISNKTDYLFNLNINKIVSLNRPARPCSSEGAIESYSLLEQRPHMCSTCNHSCYNLCMYKKRNVTDCVNIEQTVGLQSVKELNVKVCQPYYTDKDNSKFDFDLDTECESRCPETCTQWFYFSSTQTTTDLSYTQITINFPVFVMVSEENPAYDWNMLISNIGGLLGLWIGASLLSFLQGIYLFFCHPEEKVQEIRPIAVGVKPFKETIAKQGATRVGKKKQNPRKFSN